MTTGVSRSNKSLSEVSKRLCGMVQYHGDGDSKGSLTVTETKPYGDSTTTDKLKCEVRMCTRRYTKPQ